MATLNELEERIEKIENRNRKVELDKAWDRNIYVRNQNRFPMGECDHPNAWIFTVYVDATVFQKTVGAEGVRQIGHIGRRRHIGLMGGWTREE